MKKELSELHKTFLDETQKVALNATCRRSKCGSIIISDGKIIGSCFNSPPLGIKSQGRCLNKKSIYNQKVTDKTCCVHAEQRAIMDALKNNSDKIKGSTLYFMRLDDNGNKSPAGKPYCTICSKMALDVGIKEFILFHGDYIGIYDTEEYNDLSYEYN